MQNRDVDDRKRGMDAVGIFSERNQPDLRPKQRHYKMAEKSVLRDSFEKDPKTSPMTAARSFIVCLVLLHLCCAIPFGCQYDVLEEGVCTQDQETLIQNSAVSACKTDPDIDSFTQDLQV